MLLNINNLIGLILIILWISCFLCFVLYNYLETNPSLKSFLYFIFIGLLYSLYVFLIYAGLWQPKYYTYFVICVIITLLNNLPKSLPQITFLHEVMFLKYSQLDNIFYKLIKALKSSWSFRVKFMFLHFFIFYVSRIIIVIFFFCSVFFKQDLRLLMCIIPLSLFIWLLSLVEYFYSHYFSNVYKILNNCCGFYSHHFVLNICMYTNNFYPYIKFMDSTLFSYSYEKFTNTISFFISTVYIFLWSSMFGSIFFFYFGF